MISVSHWLFAVEYLRLALKFPLMLRQLGEEEIQKRVRRNSCILIGLNCFYYAQITLWTTIYFFYICINYNFILIYLLSVLDPLMPAILLIIAIWRIRSQIKGMNEREFMAREKLIRVHTCSFVFYILVSVGIQVTAYLV